MNVLKNGLELLTEKKLYVILNLGMVNFIIIK